MPAPPDSKLKAHPVSGGLSRLSVGVYFLSLSAEGSRHRRPPRNDCLGERPGLPRPCMKTAGFTPAARPESPLLRQYGDGAGVADEDQVSGAVVLEHLDAELLRVVERLLAAL